MNQTAAAILHQDSRLEGQVIDLLGKLCQRNYERLQRSQLAVSQQWFELLKEDH